MNFGRVSGTEAEQRSISIARADGGPLKPEAPGDLPQGVGVSIKEIKPGDAYELVVTLTPPLKPGRLHTNLQVKTGVPEAPTFAVPLFATIGAPARARPARDSAPPEERRERSEDSAPGTTPKPRP